jgi:GTPase SAR1 family protein
MKWIDFVRESRGSDALIYIVGNKIDLDQQRRSESVSRVQEVASQQGITYK